VRKKAAEILGISFRSIRYRLAKFDIDPGGDDD
jgi:two-component system response regulator PilR (NtrC family)